jgi:hypothetical protein
MAAGKKVEGFIEDRLCSSCRQRKKPEGGDWILFNKGLNRRWNCKECNQRRIVRLAKRK